MWSSRGVLVSCVTWCFFYIVTIDSRPESLPNHHQQLTPLHPNHHHNQYQIHSSYHVHNASSNVNRQKLPDTLVADVDYFDKLNVESQLSNKRFVDLQIKCLIYDGPCDLFGRKAKALLPSIILDNCRLCSHSQSTKLSRVVVHMQQNYPAEWRDALVKYGSSPKFITAGQAAPSVALFGGKRPNTDIGGDYQKHHHHHHHHYHHHQQQLQQQPVYIALPQTTMTVPVLPQPQSAAEAETASLGMENLYESSPAPPELIPAMESPTPPMNPTTSPNGQYQEFFITSSAQPPSTPVVESTIEVKPTTVQP